MKLTINNNSYEISDLENEYTLENTISVLLNVYPKNILYDKEFYENKITFYSKILESKNLNVKILDEEFYVSADTEKVLSDDKIRYYIQYWKNDGLKHIYNMIISSLREQNSLPERNFSTYNTIQISSFEKSIKLQNYDFIINTIRYDFNYKKNIELEFQKIKKEQEKHFDHFKKIEFYFNNLNLSDLNPERTNFKITLRLKNIVNYIFLFNNLKFNSLDDIEIILICFFRPDFISRYKFNTKTPVDIEQEFIKNLDNVKQTFSIILKDHTTKTNIIITLEILNSESDIIMVEFKNTIQHYNKILDLIFGDLSYNIIKKEVYNSKGYFTLDDSKFNKILFSHFITNYYQNSYFDERDKTQTNYNILNFFIKELKEDVAHVQIQENISKSKYFLKLTIFNIKKSENYYKILLKKMYAYYLYYYDNLTEDFKKFGIFLQNTNINSQTLLSRKSIIPELFVSKYSRKCAKIPSVYTIDEAKNLENKNIDYFIFPKQGDNSLSQQYLFSCEKYTDFKYPGLTVNTSLSNKDRFPVIPCCFKTQQQNRNTPMGRYFEGFKKNTISDHQLYKLQKPLSNNSKGIISSNILDIMNVKAEDGYYRFGVFSSNYNLLDCVLRCINNNIYIYNQEEYEKKIQIEKDKIFNNLNISLQENMNKDLINLFENNIDINFVKSLEYTYKVNIIIFNKNSIYINRHNYLGSYLILPDYKRYILLYYHETKNHLEIIGKQDKKKSTMELIMDSRFSHLREKILISINPKISFLKESIKILNFESFTNVFLNYKLKSQYCDKSGKCNMLFYEHEKNPSEKITLFFDEPKHPFPVELSNTWSENLKNKPPPNFVKDDVINEDFVMTVSKSKNILVDRYKNTISNQTCYVYVYRETVQPITPFTYDNFLKSRKTIGLVFETILFYIIKNCTSDIDNYLNNIIEVEKDNTSLYKKFISGIVPSYTNCINFYITNDKFLVNTSEIKTRLIYNLKLFISNINIKRYFKNKTYDSILSNYKLDNENTITSILQTSNLPTDIFTNRLKYLFFCNNKSREMFTTCFYPTNKNFIIKNVNINNGAYTFGKKFLKLHMILKNLKEYNSTKGEYKIKCYLYTSYNASYNNLKINKGINTFFIKTDFKVEEKYSVLCFKLLKEIYTYKLIKL